MSLKGVCVDTVEKVATRTPKDILEHDELIGDGITARVVNGLSLNVITKGCHLRDHFPAPLLDQTLMLTANHGWKKLVKSVLKLDLEIFNEWLDLSLHSVSDPYNSGSGRLVAFWRTLIEDVDPKSLQIQGRFTRLPASLDN